MVASGALSKATIANKKLGYYGGMEKVKIEHHTLPGGFWVAAWLFTIGYLKLSFWQGVFAIVIWPYYLGVHFAPVAGM